MKSVWEAIVSYIPLRSQEILTKNEPELSETFLSHASESDSFISFESKKDGYFRRLHQRQIKIRFYHLICLVLIAITVVITTLSFLWTFGNSDISCARRLSVWSPALVAVEYVEYDLENMFDQPSIYRGPPTPILEKAWSDLWLVGDLEIPEDKMPLLNRSTKGPRQWWKGSDPASKNYHALADVHHQLHCLDIIRQYTWVQAGNYAPAGNKDPNRVTIPVDFQDSEVASRMHVDHCIETLRKILICHSDVTPVLAFEDPKVPTRRVDFNLHQKCRNFEKINNWIKDHEAKQIIP